MQIRYEEISFKFFVFEFNGSCEYFEFNAYRFSGDHFLLFFHSHFPNTY